jgi:type VI secretion system protein ImpM
MAAIGFHGKLPARGDFVRAGLPGSFVAAWDGWLQDVLGPARALLDTGWDAAWMEAPVWRFCLPPGQCGPGSVLGLWMPSVDSAGRHFPLTLAAVFADGNAPADEGWLDAAEDAGRAAIAEDWSPAALLDAMPPAPAAGGMVSSDAIWWSAGSPFVPAGRFTLPALPDAARFSAMVRATAAAGTPA